MESKAQCAVCSVCEYYKHYKQKEQQFQVKVQVPFQVPPSYHFWGGQLRNNKEWRKQW